MFIPAQRTQASSIAESSINSSGRDSSRTNVDLETGQKNDGGGRGGSGEEGEEGAKDNNLYREPEILEVPPARVKSRSVISESGNANHRISGADLC
jgi:hypothetical protein